MLTYILSKTFTNVDVMGFKIGWLTWEQQKLKTVVNRVTRKNVNNESNLPLTISAQDGLIAQDHFFGKKVASQNLQNYLLLKKGDFAYNKSYSNGYPFGSIKRLNKYKEGVISSLYIAFKPKQADSDYLEQFFDSDKWHREIYSRAAEGARNHGLLNISPNDFFDADVKLPSSNEEQKMIGDILKKVSEIITLQQRKLDQLNTLKKGLLQKMFADKKHPKPELRFKGFSGDWEQRKLGDVVEITMGQSPDGKTYSDTPSEYILVQGNADLVNGWVKPRIWTTQITKEAHKGAIILSVRAPAGEVGRTKYDVVLGRGVAGIEGNEFIYQLLFRMSKTGYWNKYATGSTFASLNSKDVSNAQITVTNTQEEKQIGSLFSKIDNLVDLQQSKLDKLNSLKKSLLQNMFI